MLPNLKVALANIIIHCIDTNIVKSRKCWRIDSSVGWPILKSPQCSSWQHTWKNYQHQSEIVWMCVFVCASRCSCFRSLLLRLSLHCHRYCCCYRSHCYSIRRGPRYRRRGVLRGRRGPGRPQRPLWTAFPPPSARWDSCPGATYGPASGRPNKRHKPSINSGENGKQIYSLLNDSNKWQ